MLTCLRRGKSRLSVILDLFMCTLQLPRLRATSNISPVSFPPTISLRLWLTQITSVLREKGREPFRAEYRVEDQLSYTLWHSDVSYERQPPGTTFFWLLDQPEVGGDTLFLSQVEAYNRLSPGFQKTLEGLRAVHSGVAQVESSRKAGGIARREPVESEVSAAS